eukprot:4562953-Pleurochrysis_carterae.AAC.2
MHRPSLVKTGLRPRRSEELATRKRVTMMEPLRKAASKASSWCWATDMLRPRRRRSSSTNSDARVAALIAASLIRGGSLLAASPDCRKRESSVEVLRGSERSAWIVSCGGIRSETQVSMKALRSQSCCSRSGSTMESRRDWCVCGRRAAMRRSSTMSDVDSSKGESTVATVVYFAYVKRKRRRSTSDAPA